MTSKGYQRLLFICILILMALFMMFYVITGIMLPYLMDFYHLTIPQSGMISSFQYGGETLILFVSGFASRGTSKTKLIAGCFIATSAALAGIGLHLPFLFSISFFLVLGVCSGLFIKCASSLIAELYPDSRSRYMTILYIATGVGCMAAPYISTRQLEAGMEWWKIYLTDAAVIFISAVIFIGILARFGHTIQTKPQKAEQAENRLPPFRFLFQRGSGRIGLLCIMALLYMGHQISLTSWLPTYLIDELEMTPSFSGSVLSLFSAGLLVGRLFYTIKAERFSAERFLLVTSTLAGFILGIGLITSGKAVILSAMFLTGALTGTINPLLTGLGCDWYPQNTDAAASLICLSLSVGGMAFPYIVGRIAIKLSFFAAMLLSAVNLLLIAVLLLITTILNSK